MILCNLYLIISVLLERGNTFRALGQESEEGSCLGSSDSCLPTNHGLLKDLGSYTETHTSAPGGGGGEGSAAYDDEQKNEKELENIWKKI